MELEPNNAGVYTSRGALYALQNDLTHALDDYSRSLELDPDNTDALKKRSMVYRRQNDTSSALADLNRLLELDPSNDFALGDRGELYLAQNDLTHALADANKLLEHNPQNARAINNRAYIYLLQNDLDQALTEYNKALSLIPSWFLLLSIGVKRTSSKGIMNKRLMILAGPSCSNPEICSYSYGLEAYEGLGDRKKAIACYRQVLQAGKDTDLGQQARKHLIELRKWELDLYHDKTLD